VSRIDVHAYPPFTPGGPKFINHVVQLATSLHATTRPRIVTRFLTLNVGDRCTEFERAESERILRAQPYLAEADVRAYPDSAGGVVLDVTTVDEVSLILDGNIATASPHVRALRIGEANLGGEAIYSSLAWQRGTIFRDIFRARVIDYQFLGRPYQMSVQGSRNELGESWDTELSHPFYSERQRFSWRATAGSSNGYVYFARPEGIPEPALQLVRSYGDVGGVMAFGPDRRLLLVGASVSRERERTSQTPVLIRDSGVVDDTNSVLIGRYGEHRLTRINALLGLRNISYMRVTGFDALEGAQDVRTGAQLSTLLGKGLSFDGNEPDYFMSGDVYGGRGSPTSFVAAEIMGERRYDVSSHDWDGILASGRGAWYVKPTPRHTLVTDVEWSGGWQQRVPFQLTFSDREGGLRGYHDSGLGGAQRLVSRFEDVFRLGRFRQFGALGSAFFVDAGKLWAGDAPFGTTTGVKFSAGIGILAAFPPRSHRTWRVDFAVPVNDKHDAKFEIRFTNHDFTRWFWREPGDVQASRERSIPNSVYNWP